jgi:hypothetical protein
MAIRMNSYLFTTAVLNNLRHLRETTNSGIGYILPEPELIGRGIKDFVDRKIAAVNSAGGRRINPIGQSNNITDIYV